MRRSTWRPRSRAAMVGVVAAFALATLVRLAHAGQPPQSAAIDGSVTRSYIVATRDAGIYLEVVHPTANGEVVAAPTILTYSPYSALGRNGDAEHWVPQGYARAYADVIGTGNSGGCWDYGGAREKRTAHDVVEWIADQTWSTGKIGMLGGSYNGTTQYAAAVTHPPHLTTIVPEAAISRWYDYAYSGGVRYTLNNEWLGHQGPLAVTDEGLDTPLAFDFGLAIPPPLDASEPTWADRVRSTITPCDELVHTEHGYDLTPDYDGFWRERDYLRQLDTVSIPVLVAHNWGDWNVKQVNAWDAYHALDRSQNAVFYMGTRWEGHGTPPGEAYAETVDAWFAHYLKGERTGVESLPDVTSQTSDSTGPLEYRSGREPVTTPVRLFAGRGSDDGSGDSWVLRPRKERAGEDAPAATFTITGTNTETRAAAQPLAGGSYLGFASPPLARDVRVYGEPEIRLWSEVRREWVTVAPSILDVDPASYAGDGAATTATDSNALVAATRGWLDSRYRDGLDHQVPVTPGEPFETTVATKPTDYVFRAGHRIVLLVQTETLEWATAKPYPGCDDPGCATFRVLYEDGRTSLTIPVVGEVTDPRSLFGHSP